MNLQKLPEKCRIANFDSGNPSITDLNGDLNTKRLTRGKNYLKIHLHNPWPKKQSTKNTSS